MNCATCHRVEGDLESRLRGCGRALFVDEKGDVATATPRSGSWQDFCATTLSCKRYRGRDGDEQHRTRDRADVDGHPPDSDGRRDKYVLDELIRTGPISEATIRSRDLSTREPGWRRMMTTLSMLSAVKQAVAVFGIDCRIHTLSAGVVNVRCARNSLSKVSSRSPRRATDRERARRAGPSPAVAIRGLRTCRVMIGGSGPG